MFSRLFGMFRGNSVLIQGAGKLQEGQSKRIEIGDAMAGGTEVVLARVKGELCAIDRVCPHEGGRISDGPLLDGEHVLCPLHNYRFDPKTGEAVGVSCKKAKTYKVREKDGDAEIWV